MYTKAKIMSQLRNLSPLSIGGHAETKRTLAYCKDGGYPLNQVPFRECMVSYSLEDKSILTLLKGHNKDLISVEYYDIVNGYYF